MMTQPDAWVLCTFAVCVTVLIMTRRLWWGEE